jgi:hypothetical protein
MATREEKVAAIIADIKENPKKHLHDFGELLDCCMVVDGEIDAEIMEAHRGLGRTRKCDALRGPCACGAWHDEVEEG